MYVKFDKNTKNMVLFATDVSIADTKDKIVNAYKQQAGITPTFPIILYGEGGKAISDLFRQTTSGQQTFIVLPNRTFTGTPYNETTLTDNINKALATGLLENPVYEMREQFHIQIFDALCTISSPYDALVTLSLFTLRGQLLESQELYLQKGLNQEVLKNEAVQVMPIIVDISSPTRVNFRARVLNKQELR